MAWSPEIETETPKESSVWGLAFMILPWLSHTPVPTLRLKIVAEPFSKKPFSSS
jgi:hypothetical protein